MRDIVGYSAAGALGYITGNLPGALVAGKLYGKFRKRKNLPKDMAPTRSRITKKRKDKSNKWTIKKKKEPEMFNRGKVVSAGSSNEVMTKGYDKSGKNTKKSGGKKELKVSNKFVKSVKKALTVTAPNGYYTERFYNKYKPIDFNQFVIDTGTGWSAGQTGLSAGGIASFFDPFKVLDAASVLFNGKVANGLKDNTNPNLFPAQSFVIDVQKQWVRQEYKNNTARRLTLKLWTWELKHSVALPNFSTFWEEMLTKDSTLPDGRLNVLSNTRETLGQSPMFNPGVKKYFKIMEEDISLEPGKTYVHYVQGPAKKYDYSKFWNSSIGFLNQQKGNKGVCMALSLDVTSTSTGGAGVAQRYTDIVAADAFGLLVETQYNYVLSVPDQTGFRLTFTIPAVGPTTIDNQTPLMKRRGNPYACVNWNQIGQAGTVVDIEDENPQAQAVNGL